MHSPLTDILHLARTTGAPALTIATGSPRFLEVSIDPRDGSPRDDQVLFNFGSIAKTFTTAVLARLVLDGRLDLDASVRDIAGKEWLPDVTVRALATHTSGLPREPPRRAGQPRTLDSVSALREALAATTNRPHGRYRYSNLGYLALGHLIQQISGRPLPDLARELIFSPLRMHDTHYADDSSSSPPIGVRIDNGNPAPDRTTLPGPGGFYGTAGDLLRWTEAIAQPPDSLRDVIDLATHPHLALGRLDGVPETWSRPARRGARQLGLAWRLEADGLAWHTGGTNGYTTFCAANRNTGTASVALLAAGIGALPDTARALPSAIKLLRLRTRLLELARA